MASQQITGIVGRGVSRVVGVGPVHSRLTVVARVTWSSHISGALYRAVIAAVTILALSNLSTNRTYLLYRCEISYTGVTSFKTISSTGVTL